MRSAIYSAVFLLTLSWHASAQTIIRDTNISSVNAGEVALSRLDERPIASPTPTTTPDPNSSNWYTRPAAKKRFNKYILSMVGPAALATDVVTAGYSTWRNSPREWGDRWEGFGRRFASNFGTGVIKETAIYTMDEAFKIDSSYYRSRKKDVGSKLNNALLSTVTARNRNGKRVIGAPRIVGTYLSSGLARELWYPGRYSFKDGFESGSVSLGLNAAFNLVKEFLWKK